MDHQASLDDWVARYKQSLQDAARQLVQTAPTRTLSDFPLLSLTYDGSSKLLTQSLPRLGLSPADVEEAYPCTPTQRLMLRAQSRQPKLYATTFLGAVRVVTRSQAPCTTGTVTIRNLKAAWQTLVSRHPSLRTVFVPTDDPTHDWVQEVLKDAKASTLELRCSPRGNPESASTSSQERMEWRYAWLSMQRYLFP
ncbi:hypothetical protein VTK56DRAFT_4960 [Thermocarpiscus australiensis]